MHRLDVLVVDAVGIPGSAVAQALLHAGHTVRAVTPDLAHPSAESLRVRGARLVWAAPDDPAGLGDAMHGADVVFADASSAGGPAAELTRRGLALVELAQRAAVGHFIFSSAMPSAALTGVTQFDARHEIEQYLRASGVPHTILAPGFFMEYLLAPPWREHLRSGALPIPLGTGRRLQLIAVADLARFVRLVLDRPEQFYGRRTCLASDEATPIGMCAALARVIGHSITPAPPLAADRLLPPWTRDAFAWFDRHSGCASVQLLRVRYPEVNWHTLDGWARRQSW